MTLSAKQEQFCREYLIDLNATQAATRAGYSEATAGSQGERLLRNVEIKLRVDELMEKRSERTAITADYVLSTITETIERCRQAAPVFNRKGEQVYIETPEGKAAPAFMFDAKNVLKGTELLGRHLKLFTDNVDMNVNGTINVIDDIK